MPLRSSPLSAFAIAASLVFATACGGGGGGGNGGGSGGGNGGGAGSGSGGGANDSVRAVLESFGVDTTATDRIDEDGDDLPPNFAPLGSTRRINAFAEIALFGVGLAPSPETGRMPVIDVRAGAGNSFTTTVLDDKPTADFPWFGSGAPGVPLPRAAVTGDFDVDGLDEIAIVYQEPNEPIELVIMQDADEGFALGEARVIDATTVSGLELAAGDFDGDGRDDLLVAQISSGADTTVQLLRNEAGTLELNGQSFSIPSGSLTTTAQLVMVPGNLDFDNGIELGVVVNDPSRRPAINARHFVYDDADTDFALLRSGLVTVDTGDAVETARVASIDLADVDGDGLDELLLGGLDLAGPVSGDIPRYLLQVSDDAKRGFAPLASNGVSSEAGELRPTSSGANQTLSFLHVLGADIDGDGAKEIVTNQFVYEDLAASPGVLTPYDDGRSDEPARIPLKDLFADGDSGDDYSFTAETSAMAAGDVTSDGRENIVLFAQRLSVDGERQEVQVWGDDQIDGWSEILDVETSPFANPINNDGRLRARILLPDIDMDNGSLSLQYSAGSYRYALTEPIVIAALAAAPCTSALGQNLDSCRTAYGQAVSEGTTRSGSVSLSAGISVGVAGELPFNLGSAEAVRTIQATARRSVSQAYEVTKSILRETGPIEDSVIFTTIPLDIYTYTILSHPDPTLIGGEVEVRLPREPIEVLTTLSTYNDNIEADAFRIDSRVFGHTPGDPESYPSASEKNGLLSRFDGLESSQVDVGSGGGRTTLTIDEFSSTTRGQAFEYQEMLDVRVTTGGVVRGFNVGFGIESALEISRGEQTIYQGSVGHIDTAFFPQEVYSIGLFAYIYDDSAAEQPFEVLNYWVE